ncbi:hypothetical protein CKM354_000135900 [Cercospora kikuchii]|uniref:Uncharacterized protein n=1 Tax=Cercospora kikuchii TaxID=84275 RepID=A0A9P3CDB6_9PEZI|nr:uncharacterized protein CKM354_000135900 [Cercospora kikuchii]GIZ37930.1 hypothetical protein CKM354_000135900 [Cercospora kikuchii]
MAGSCGSRPSGLTPTGRSTQLVLTTLPTCIGPIATCLAQSEPKKRFFERLGLDEGNKLHRRLYLNMKVEVVEGWKRMTANRDSLVLQLRDDPTVEPPYGFNYIDDQIMHDEIARIFHDARPDTRLMFNLGRTSRVDPGENWIIRWLLWHIFRYRDGRNVQRRHFQRPAPARVPCLMYRWFRTRVNGRCHGS